MVSLSLFLFLSFNLSSTYYPAPWAGHSLGHSGDKGEPAFQESQTRPHTSHQQRPSQGPREQGPRHGRGGDALCWGAGSHSPGRRGVQSWEEQAYDSTTCWTPGAHCKPCSEHWPPAALWSSRALSPAWVSLCPSVKGATILRDMLGPGTRGPELGDSLGPRPAAPAQWTPRISPGEGIQWVFGGGVIYQSISTGRVPIRWKVQEPGSP